MKRRGRRLLLLFAVLCASGVGVVYYLVTREPAVRADSWLSVRVDSVFPDRHLPASILGQGDSEVGMLELMRCVRIARGDDRVIGVMMVLDDDGVPAHRVRELVTIVEDLRRSGKHVSVFARRYTLSSWVVATHADTISLHPMGVVDLRPPRLTVPFFGKALAQAGLQADIVWVNEDKGVHEQFISEKPSDRLVKQLEALYSGFWERLQGLAQQRESTGSLVRAAASAGSYSAQQTLEEGWIDFIEDGHEFQQRLLDEDQSRLITLDTYRQVSPARGGLDVDPQIAVLSLEGVLVDGESRNLPLYGRLQGLEELRRAVDEIASTPSLRGVIVHINSSGGEIFASDEAWRVLDRLQNDLPVVALLGSQATSGGYYAALSCEQIYASPETLIGSIGAIGGRLVATELLEKIGVVPFTVGEESKTAPSRWEAYSETDRATVKRQLTEQFDTFVSRVRVGRGLDMVKATEVCSGRMYLGTEARKRRLVDDVGGFEAAWRGICDLAEVRNPDQATSEVFPRQRGVWSRVVDGTVVPKTLVPLPGDALSTITRERGWFIGPIFDWK